MATRKKQPKTLQAFVKDALNTPNGRALLDELTRIYVNQDLFDSDALVMARRAGRAALVLTLSHLLTSEDLTDDGNDVNDASAFDL